MHGVARLTLLSFLILLLWPLVALAQEQRPPSNCLAMAEALPGATYVNFTPASAEAGEVKITYAGHSTYVIESPHGVRVATDFNGLYGADPLPTIVTMNKAHHSHYTDHPDPRIKYVLRGWNPAGGAAHHALIVDDVFIRNVPTDIRGLDGTLEKDGNSIFIFEIAGLCIGHLGHLHVRLTDAHYAAIGRLDVVMVPIDGGLTMTLPAMSEIARRLRASVILPMHRFSTPISAFASLMGQEFGVEFRDSRSLTVSLKTLPSRPTIIVLDGV